jgi:hypothetical protein
VPLEDLLKLIPFDGLESKFLKTSYMNTKSAVKATNTGVVSFNSFLIILFAETPSKIGIRMG